MSRYVVVLTLLTVIYQCEGHLGRLTDAVLGAHKHVHDTVHNVASSVLGGLTGGFSLNIGGHAGFMPAPGTEDGSNPFRRPPYEQPEHHLRPPMQPYQGNHYYQQHGNQGNYGVQQGQNGYHHQMVTPPNEQPSSDNTPFQGNDGNDENVGDKQQPHQNDNGNQQGQNGNHKGISTPSNQHHDQPSSENKPVHQNDANDQFHRPEQQNNPYQEQDRDVNKPTEIPDDHKKATSGTTTRTTEPAPTDAPHTTKSDGDAPLFVPLSPDQYNYEGDKIEVNAPKRDTDKTQEYDIDIRFKDE